MLDRSLPFALTRPAHVDHVRLVVKDLDQMSAYYRKVIGLEVIEKAESGHVLGVAGRPLLSLIRDANAEQAPRNAPGLFHTAFLLPTRQDLAHWLKHAADSGIALEGASDHIVSEALYLSDPEGNGIEIYRDRKPEEWTFKADGMVEMATARLNLQDLHAEAPKTSFDGMADGSSVGHIHLQVGDVPQAEAFYRDVLGLKVMARYPGASFFATGGYHHHVAANIWNSRGAGPRRSTMTGLSGYTLKFNDPALLATALESLQKQEIAADKTAEGWALRDPWGIGITLSH